jgi:hypothetical protein
MEQLKERVENSLSCFQGQRLRLLNAAQRRVRSLPRKLDLREASEVYRESARGRKFTLPAAPNRILELA